MFQLNRKEQAKLNRKLKIHDKKCKFSNLENQGAIGGRLTYCFSPTSLGILAEVKCICGTIFSIADTSDW